ncbi:MAG TPA: trypsin-like peptidase domain-containing protein, partial [Gemmata sp.]|nr:trypsin-like peptidase domain-containing protein [Gemmata sp.]
MYPNDGFPRAGRTSSIFPLLILTFLLAGSVALIAWWVQPWRKIGLNTDAQPRPVAARGELSEQEKMNISIYETASPSVVHVTNLATRGSQFSLNVQRIPKGTGSGFVWDEDGHIVTNYHVVEGADAARVTLPDHSTYNALNIWAAPEADIAVIQIDAPKGKLHPILVGRSEDLKVGQITYAIGNPFGLDQSLTTGIVSALGREIESDSGSPIHGAIQTSAAINPGNSGGPLLDSAGRLIGMNTAIVSPTGSFSGIGFALPVDQINQTVTDLIRNGKTARPKLGIQIAVDQLAHQFDVNEGVLILKVIPDTSAAQAGLRGTQLDESGNKRLGDVIVAVDGEAIKQVKDLYAVLDKHKS